MLTKSFMYSLFFQVLFFSLFSTIQVFAAPILTSVSGTFLNNKTITLQGSNFGKKPIASPIKFDNFENGTNGSSLSAVDPNWHAYSPSEGEATFSTKDHRSGLKSVTVHNSLRPGKDYENFKSNYFSTMKLTNPKSYNEIFVSYWWKNSNFVPGGTTTVKLTRINSSLAAGGSLGLNKSEFYNGTGNTSLGGTYNIGAPGSQVYMASDNGVTSEYADWNVTRGAEPLKDTWTRIDAYKKLSSVPGAPDGIMEYKIYGRSAVSMNKAVTVADCSAAGKDPSFCNFKLDTVLLGLMDGNANFHDYDLYIDDIYIDNTRARVEICNAPTWTGRTQCDAQPATAWSESSITFTVNQGGIPTSSQRYLYVVDSNGNANENGYAVNFDTVTISAPNLHPPVIIKP